MNTIFIPIAGFLKVKMEAEEVKIGHAYLLIVERNIKTIWVFDSQGFLDDLSKLEKEGPRMVDSLFGNKQYISSFFPDYHWNHVSDKFSCNVVGYSTNTSGNCALFTLLFLHLCIRYPER